MGTVWRTARQTRRPSPPCAKSRHRVVTMSWPLLRQSFRDWREARTPCQIVGLARRKRPVKTDEEIKVVLLLICCWSVHRRRVVVPISLFQAAKAASAKRRRASKAISSMSLGDMNILLDDLKGQIDRTQAQPDAPLPLAGLLGVTLPLEALRLLILRTRDRGRRPRAHLTLLSRRVLTLSLPPALLPRAARPLCEGRQCDPTLPFRVTV